MSTRGERLSLAMEARNVRKQHALACQLGVHESAITRWKEDGALSLTNAVALCRALDISLDWLLLERGTIDSHKTINEPLQIDGTRLDCAFSELLQQMTDRTQACLESFVTLLRIELPNPKPRPRLQPAQANPEPIVLREIESICGPAGDTRQMATER